MTADLLQQRVLSRLRERRNEVVMRLRLCKPRNPTVFEQGVVAASSSEEIAMLAVDINATVDALDNAIAVIQEEFKKLTSPEQEPDFSTKPKMPAR